MTEQEQQTILEYVKSFRYPAEVDFLSAEQKKALEAERAKLENTEKFINSVLNKDNFEDTINKAVIEGRIYSPSQFANISAKLETIENRDANRVDVSKTLVTKTGQRIIMSARIQELLAYYSDGWVLKEELNNLTQCLQQDGVAAADIDRVTAAMNKYGAIVLQRGVFIPLKPMLEEAVGTTLPIVNENSRMAMPAPTSAPTLAKEIPMTAPVPAPAVVPPSTPAQNFHPVELPVTFIDYLKQEDKDYGKVEKEVVDDPMFQDFFANLKAHFAYYKTLTAEKMAWEVIIRPQLWVKLSPRTRAWVQNIVSRNQEAFLEKVQKIAHAARVAELEDLKKTLNK